MTTVALQYWQDAPQCQALSLADTQPCRQPATRSGLFCCFHSDQCQGLYKGYKRRNAALDELEKHEPEFLKTSTTALINQTFADVRDQEEVKDIHAYLFKRNNLLRGVIEARNKHHRHFYSQSMDYGHQAYLNRLVDQHRAVQKALSNLERRTAEILFKEEKWYDWVRTEQDDKEANEEKEAKKIKMEAALFRRHWQSTEARLKAARAKEEKKRQEAYLEEVWRERMAESATEGVSDEEWDPIEDVFQDDREKFIDLIRHFLWMEVRKKEGEDDMPGLEPVEEGMERLTLGRDGMLKLVEASGGAGAPTGGAGRGDGVYDDMPGLVPLDAELEGEGEASAPKKKKKKKPKKKKPKKKKPAAPSKNGENGEASAPKSNGSLPDKSNIESREDVAIRLTHGVQKDYSHVKGPMLAGSLQMPRELYGRTAPLAEVDVQRLVSEITEIKLFLFCRQILGHPALLPAALRANSTEEFLADDSIPEADLRDLCLRVEQPGLQALRDACADFARGDDDDEEEEEEDVEEPQSAANYLRHSMRYGDLEDYDVRVGTGLLLDLSSINRRKIEGQGIADAKLEPEKKNRKIKITICGNSIWNYASQSSMARDGWLHFSIMAKDCSFHDAIALCRNWDEFFDLHLLAGWQFFPASKWTSWSGGLISEELITMGFVPFYEDLSAEKLTTYHKFQGPITRRALDREEMVVECRNVMCAHMKRNDPISRRFIQYVLMRRGDALILVIDGKTGKVVVAPEKSDRWLTRAVPGRLAPLPGESGPGTFTPWRNVTEIGPDFFDRVDQHRKWHFGFGSYYEIYMWDFAPGEDPQYLYQLIQECMLKARRMRGMRDKYEHQKHITVGLTRDKQTYAVRQIRPGEKVKSLYDELNDPSAGYYMRTKTGNMVRTQSDLPPGESLYLFYNKADEAEDAILFDENIPDNFPFIEITNPVQMLEAGGMPPSLLNYTANSLAKDLFRRGVDGGNTRRDDANDMPRLQELDAVSDDDEMGWESDDSVDGPKPYAPGKEEFGFSVPPVWEQAHRLIAKETGFSLFTKSALTPEQLKLLKKLDFSSVKLRIPTSELTRHMGKQEILERDRAYVFKDTFHLGDLEPGSQEKHATSTKLLRGIQKFIRDTPTLDWPWFCMEVLDWMHLKLYYNKYPAEPLKPWPHRYIVQDITQAFVSMALFFPNLEVTSLVKDYLSTEEGKEFKNSPIFDQLARSKDLPNRRTRTSNRFRPPEFWKDLDKLNATGKCVFDIYPMDWSLAIRPIIAKLYRAGALGPAPLQPLPQVVPGVATAAKEPHRPGKLDLFVQYDWTNDFMAEMPPNYIDYTEWPELLPEARAFARKHSNPRFALIKLWSAPHFYPLMMMIERRQPMSFIDSVGRAWEWKFLPKDMPASEWSIHNTVRLRLGCLRQAIIGSTEAEVAAAAAQAKLNLETADLDASGKQKSRTARRHDKVRDKMLALEKWKADEKWNYGTCELDERVFHRGDLVLVMGTDETDLLKWVTAVTLSLQTKPWLREVDLWKSFVNVDLPFLEGLDDYWLGKEIPRGRRDVRGQKVNVTAGWEKERDMLKC